MKHTKQMPRTTPLFFSLLFAAGAVSYYTLEILFRGFSHWTMAICGGLCLCLIFEINRAFSTRSLLLRALLGALTITVVEFFTGCIVNLGLHWNVWDYSHLPFHIFGQISLTFSSLWFLLCIPICFGCSALEKVCFSKSKGKTQKGSF